MGRINTESKLVQLLKYFLNEDPLEEGKLTNRLINPCRSIVNDPQTKEALHSLWKK